MQRVADVAATVEQSHDRRRSTSESQLYELRRRRVSISTTSLLLQSESDVVFEVRAQPVGDTPDENFGAQQRRSGGLRQKKIN